MDNNKETKTIYNERIVNSINNNLVTEIIFGDSVEEINLGIFKELDNLEEIVVSDDNKVYKTIEGVLYTKDLSELIKYPKNKNDEVFYISSSLSTIHDYAFYGAKYLYEVYLPINLSYIGYGAFSKCPNLSIYTELNDLYVNSLDNKEWNVDNTRVVYNYYETNDYILEFLLKKSKIDKELLVNKYNLIDFNYDKIYALKEVIDVELKYISENDLSEEEMLVFLNSKNTNTLRCLVVSKPVYKYESVLNKIRENIELASIYIKDAIISDEQRDNEIKYLKNKFKYPKSEFYEFILDIDNSGTSYAKLFVNVHLLNVRIKYLKFGLSLDDIKELFNLTDEKALEAKALLKRDEDDDPYAEMVKDLNKWVKKISNK